MMDGPKILEVVERYRKYFIEKESGLGTFRKTACLVLKKRYWPTATACWIRWWVSSKKGG